MRAIETAGGPILGATSLELAPVSCRSFGNKPVKSWPVVAILPSPARGLMLLNHAKNPVCSHHG
jgi:hypothetical protein